MSVSIGNAGILLFHVDGNQPVPGMALQQGWYYQSTAFRSVADTIVRGPFPTCEAAFTDARKRLGWP